MSNHVLRRATQAFTAGQPQQALAELGSIDEALPPANFFTLKALCSGATGTSQDLLTYLGREVVAHPENLQAQDLLRALTGGAMDRASQVVSQILFDLGQGTRPEPSQSNPEQPRQLGPDDLGAAFPGVSFGNAVQVLGMANIAIGSGSCIGDNTWLNVCLRDQHKRLVIGSCVLVGRQSMISTGGNLEIGDYCLFAPRVYISDADHTFQDLTAPVLQQPATLGRNLVVEENCWFGINTVISGGVTIGRGSVVAANSVVLDDVPPFCVVAGNPARIIKMLNPITGAWERTRTDDDCAPIHVARTQRPLPSREQYREVLRKNASFERISELFTGRGFCF